MDPRLKAVEILTFDCYGTLIDWESGLRDELDLLRQRYQTTATVDSLLTEWEAIQFGMITGPYRKYREILRDSLRDTFARHGAQLAGADADRLANAIGRWPPFDDTCQSLHRLAARYRLAILSNIDDDILADSVRLLETHFDALVTAEQLQSYKPARRHFEAAIERFGRPAGNFLHCAFGFKYDQAPALATGMQTAWIKRPGWIRDDEAAPTFEAASLAELCELLDV